MQQLVDHSLQLKDDETKNPVKISRDEGAVLTCGPRGHRAVGDTVALASIWFVNTDVVGFARFQGSDSGF